MNHVENAEDTKAASSSPSSIVGTTETTPAVPLRNPSPKYPPAAVRQRIQGRVVLRISITPGGLVSHVDIAETSGYRILDEAASEAVGRWRFTPARRDGEPVAWTARLPVRFRLN